MTGGEPCSPRGQPLSTKLGGIYITLLSTDTTRTTQSSKGMGHNELKTLLFCIEV